MRQRDESLLLTGRCPVDSRGATAVGVVLRAKVMGIGSEERGGGRKG